MSILSRLRKAAKQFVNYFYPLEEPRLPSPEIPIQPRLEREEPPFVPEAIIIGHTGGSDEGRSLTHGEVNDFINRQVPLFFVSTNVAMAQYLAYNEQLIIVFAGSTRRGVATYVYSNVKPDLAISLALSESKGRWVWANLRRNASIPYARIG